MAEKVIRGEFEYNEKLYPFVIENGFLTVIQTAFHYSEDFEGKEELGTLVGVTDTNKYILLLDCEIWNPYLLMLNGKIIITLHGYVLQNERDDRYDRINFYSPALNTFYSPKKAWIPKINNRQNLEGLAMKSRNDSIQQATVNVFEENIRCTLDFDWNMSLHPEKSDAFSVKTFFSMTFPEQKTSADLGKYYLYLRDFLAFANFRNEIPFDKITLWRINKEGKFYKSAEAAIFQKDNIVYDSEVRNTITYDDLGPNSFSALFKEIAEQRNLNTYNPHFIPSDKADSSVFDRAKWLVTAISFEGEFDKRYKNVKAEQTEQFYEAKQALLSVVDQEVEKSGVSINNRKNKYFKAFRHLIENYDTTIKEKFEFCETHFATEIESIKTKLCKRTGVPLGMDFAENYSVERNRAAHGIIDPIESEDIVTFSLLRCFIYLLVMERASVSTSEMKKIMMKLFF